MNLSKPNHFVVFVFILIFYSCIKESNYIVVTDEDIFVSSKEISDSEFLGDVQCKECHQAEFKEWKGSHHDKAMQVADSLSVLGDFNNAVFTSQGVTSKFFKKDNSFFVNTEGPDGGYQEYEIVYTFGITPLQQYIVEFPNGRYQCLRTAWDTVKGKWFDLYPDFKVVHSEWLHWSRGGLNWNTMCSDCHSTNVRKNYHSKTESYNTKYALINVSCEACHGPGKQHVEDVKRFGENYTNSGTFQMTLRTKPKELVDQCARCHMRREQFSASFNFEGTMLDHYFPQLIEEPQYYPDGQILDEDYVYGSFVQSKMYKNDVSCNDCHNSHSLKLKFEGNALCTQCHSVERYNATKHHFHEMGTESALCINCHMPGKYYMGNDFRRDHSFRVPRPDLSVKYGTPNACVNCHKEKSNEWAWEEFKEMFGTVDSTHFSDKLVPGILAHPHGDLGLVELIKDTKQAEVVRASAIKALSNYDVSNFINEYLNWLNDNDPLVRAASIDVLGNLDNQGYYRYFLPLLKDPKRSIRIKTFYALGAINEPQIPKDYIDVYKKVKKEFDIYLDANSDFVGGLLKKADFYIKKGELQKGIKLYENALSKDNLNNQIRFILANLYYQSGNLGKAESAFKKIIVQEPEFGQTYYSLALLLAEIGDDQDAIKQMEKAKTLMPNNVRIYYNLGLLYNKINDKISAEETLVSGLKIYPTDNSLLYALAYHYSTIGKSEKARELALKLVQLYPDNPGYQSFFNTLSN